MLDGTNSAAPIIQGVNTTSPMLVSSVPQVLPPSLPLPPGIGGLANGNDSSNSSALGLNPLLMAKLRSAQDTRQDAR